VMRAPGVGGIEHAEKHIHWRLRRSALRSRAR
jgi:hypothetical protein